jgi:hypothetical protein
VSGVSGVRDADANRGCEAVIEPTPLAVRNERDFSSGKRGAVAPVSSGKSRITVRLDAGCACVVSPAGPRGRRRPWRFGPDSRPLPGAVGAGEDDVDALDLSGLPFVTDRTIDDNGGRVLAVVEVPAATLATRLA